MAEIYSIEEEEAATEEAEKQAQLELERERKEQEEAEAAAAAVVGEAEKKDEKKDEKKGSAVKNSKDAKQKAKVFRFLSPLTNKIISFALFQEEKEEREREEKERKEKEEAKQALKTRKKLLLKEKEGREKESQVLKEISEVDLFSVDGTPMKLTKDLTSYASDSLEHGACYKLARVSGFFFLYLFPVPNTTNFPVFLSADSSQVLVELIQVPPTIPYVRFPGGRTELFNPFSSKLCWGCVKI